MSAKAILVFCAQALLVKSAMSQCIGAAPYDIDRLAGWGIDGLRAPLEYDRLAGWGIDGLRAPLEYDRLAGFARRGLGLIDGFAAPIAYDGLTGFGGILGYNDVVAPGIEITPTSGGALPVTSVSGEAPIGLRVISANVYQGDIEMVGELPFVGTVGFENVDLPTLGAGAVNHACGNGVNAMISDDAVFAPEYYGAYAPGLGYRAGCAGRGYVL